MTMRALILSLMFLFVAGAALAVEPSEQLKDPILEGRAREISKELRCLVCQNQSIDDSNADLARDLRRIVRERLVAGDSDEEVVDYIVARYGQFVLLRPPFEPATWLLWFGPLVVLLAGAGIAILVFRRGRAGVAPALDPQEQARIDRLLGRTE
ncbi:cytochrome c-type biogenesis protein [Parvibaculum sp.]|uniref:cytochrome c-type biogenesis protein n=1 Tax=Parvibaculum sp. TaxID=2024848 RepID=UPI002D03F8D8|nr:cytochrome c-type biogenesis protein [Parvibaculum sp.]HUD50649.1 cytochrome c-type biogenesis protein [Parvibaculum sp.]